MKIGSGNADGKILLAQGKRGIRELAPSRISVNFPVRDGLFFPAGLPGIPHKVSGNSSFNLKISGIGEKSLNFKEDGS